MPTSFITVDELRVAVGRATKDQTEAAPFSDAELQAIIDRHKANAEALIRQRIEKMVMSGSVGADDVFVQETVSLTQDGPYATGTIDDTLYYLVASQQAWDSAGDPLTFDRDLQRHVQGFFERRRYRLVGDEVHALPKTLSSITLYLPDRDKANEKIGGEVVQNANANIIQEARSTMEMMIGEGSRLEGTDYLGSDNDQ